MKKNQWTRGALALSVFALLTIPFVASGNTSTCPPGCTGPCTQTNGIPGTKYCSPNNNGVRQCYCGDAS